MKFKASFTDDGISLLDKRFLPAIDKVGRVCHVYLTPTHAMLLHNLLGSTGPDGDGPQCVAQFAKDLLFREYNVSSRDGNRVAFSVDVALLHRAIRSALAVHAQSPAAGDAPAAIQVKLVNKQTPGSRSAAPFLTFETKGARSAVVQDVPISKPLSRSDVARLQDALDAAQELPETLVQVPDLQQLQNLVDRLKNIGDLLSVTVTQYANAPVVDQNVSATIRMEMAVERGEALSVQVSMKHLVKSLQCHLAKPDCTFYGIAPNGACLTVIFQYFIPGTRLTDKSISFYCRLPVLDPGTS
uniref:Checkpoint protein n=1 Tax=Aegilops tauschii subsp. strangulata TaxID=200361 RepID=A0A453CGJ8_AEGTS